mgnify:CR=1 FL=1
MLIATITTTAIWNILKILLFIIGPSKKIIH